MAEVESRPLTIRTCRRARRRPRANTDLNWLLSNASKLRDLVLAGAAGIYGLGFIIWSLHAWINDLGLLPALHAQYIIAGLVPTILLSLSAVPLYTLKRRISFSDRVLKLVRGIIGFLSVLLLLILSVYILHVLGTVNIPQLPQGATAVFAVVYYVLMNLVFLLFIQGVIGSAWARRNEVFSYYLIILGIMIGTIGYYALALYPNLPQALGGIEPRCAHLDIDPSKISEDSRTALFSTVGNNTTTRRSNPVNIYYAGDNWLLVKIPPGPKTYEIDRDAINSIIWEDASTCTKT